MKEILEKELDREIKKIFFIGIGGSSMSGLARISKEQGFEVAGSDMIASGYTQDLQDRGIDIKIGHDSNNISDDTDLVVFSAAIHDENPEMVRAKELGLPRIERSDYLGLLSRDFETTIGVAGTHGKTTTSSMIAQILYDNNFNPSVSIGGRLDEIGGNAHLGSEKYFIVESCEFVDSFLKTQHEIGVITNIEEDHLDYFTGGLRQIKQSFHRFGMIIPHNGIMVACGDEEDVREVCLGLKCPVIYYGKKDKENQWIAKEIKYDKEGNPSFSVYREGKYYGSFNLIVPGEHNVLNALAAIIVADYLGLSADDIKKPLSEFKGAHRRFEFRGCVNNINVYEDYAHHPTELRVVIESALNHDHNNLWVVFQPHTYSRTKLLFDDFVDAFEKADKIILNDIYSDRETNEKYDIFSEDIAKRIKAKYHKPVIVLSEFESIIKFLTDNLVPEDLVLVAGSQTINKVAFDLVDKLKEIYDKDDITELNKRI